MQPFYTENEYVTYAKGNGILCCHVDAVHATPPRADLYTDQIVTLLVAHTGCAGIVGTVSRRQADLNRDLSIANEDALQAYRFAIQDVLLHIGIIGDGEALTTPYLHLAIHGMRDSHYGPDGIEIGTRCGHSCSPEVRDWFVRALISKSRDILPQVRIEVDSIFAGDTSIVSHRFGDGKDYRGYGMNFNTFQIELARTLRENYLPQIVELLSLMIYDFQSVFVCPR